MNSHAPRRQVFLDAHRQQLDEWRARPDATPRVQQRLRILALLAEGRSASQVARDLGVSRETVRRWVARVANDGLESVWREQPGRGRPPGRSIAVVARVQAALARPDTADLTLRQLAAIVGTSAATVQRIRRDLRRMTDSSA